MEEHLGTFESRWFLFVCVTPPLLLDVREEIGPVHQANFSGGCLGESGVCTLSCGRFGGRRPVLGLVLGDVRVHLPAPVQFHLLLRPFQDPYETTVAVRC